MTPAERKLIAHLLKGAAQEFSNHGCNDLFLTKEVGLTPEEVREIQSKVTEEGEPSDGELIQDWKAMRVMAARLKESFAPLGELDLGDDVLLGSTTAFLWDEEWNGRYPTAVEDDVKIDVSVISGHKPRCVEICFDWQNVPFVPPPPKQFYEEDGCAYESPAIPLQFTPETAIQLGELLIEAGMRSKK